jgi:glutamate carboxypeptidase
MTLTRPHHPVRRGLAAACAFLTVAAIACFPGSSESKSISAPRTPRSTPRGAAASSALSATEKRLVAEVNKGVPASLDLLERAVDVNSGTMNPEGVRQVGAMFEPELKALGFTTRWVDGSGWGRAGHLIATRNPAGEAAPSTHHRPGVRDLGGAPKAAKAANAPVRLLLIGHLDTVFEKDSPFQRYQKLDDSTARGPGVSDMKGGDVVMLLALKALKATGQLDRMGVTVFLSGDEEKPGAPLDQARHDLFAAADWADVAIGFENGASDPNSAVTARRGSGGWRLAMTARPFHSSQIFRDDVGPGAIFATARILETFRDSLKGEASLTYNPGVILGGTEVTYDPAANRGTAFGKTNVIAESTVVTGDLRPLSQEQRARAQATMRRIVAASEPHTSGSIEFEDSYPPLAPSDGNLRLLALYDRASRDLGLGPVVAVDPTRVGGADVAFAGDRVEMTLDGVGLKGSDGHTVDESANLHTLPIQAQRAAVLMSRLAESRGKKAK